MADTLKWFPIVILLFILQFRLVNNVAHTKTKEFINVDGYDAKKYNEDFMKLANYHERRKRSRSENLDDEDVDRLSDNLRKKYSKQNRRRKKHGEGKKEQIKDDKVKLKEKKLSQALTSEVERELGLHEDAVGNPCVAGPCAHGGACTWNREGHPSFRCNCKLGFQGDRCEREIEECESLPCKERGDCVATPKGFLCLCKDGYGGKFCEVSQKTHALVPESYRRDSSDGVNISADTLQTVYITVGVVGSLLGVLVLSLCIHCCRVWNKRLKYTQECRNIIENNGSISELPRDVCEISDALCREFWCCSCIDLQGQANQYDELLGEFRSSTQNVRADSPFPEMNYPQRLIQSEGALPNEHGSYRSFRSLPPKMKSFTKRPSWLPDVELSNDADSVDSVNSPSPSRTRPRRSSPSRKSFGTAPDLPMQMAHDGTVSEDSLEHIDILNNYHESQPISSGDVSPPHYTSASSQSYRHSHTAHSPTYSPKRSTHTSPNHHARQSNHNSPSHHARQSNHKSPSHHARQSTHNSANHHSRQSTFDNRASVRSILAHLSQTHPPLPNLPSDQSGSSSTFS